MTLTVESLEAALMEMAGHIESMEKRIALRPTHLIMLSNAYSELCIL